MQMENPNQSDFSLGAIGAYDNTSGDDDAAVPIAKSDREREASLEAIKSFVIQHGLDVTAANLAAAQVSTSLSDPLLASKIHARLGQGKALTQDWLDSVMPNWLGTNSEHSAIDALGTKLESVIASFSQTIDKTQTQTGEFREEMAQHVANATHPSENDSAKGSEQSPVISLSHAMLDTLKRIEGMIEKSQSETANLREDLSDARRQANTDHLTALPNRRAFERHFDHCYETAQKEGTALHVAICDIDHFKRVNDDFGHQTGDNLLRAIADILAQHTSGDSFVARHGGEEFVVLFMGLDKVSALAELNAAREALSQRKFVARRKRAPIGQVTFSGGIADVMSAATKSEALAKADAALYDAKNSGRNCIKEA
jgi:diguanylate cyclase